ncbi:MAG: LamG domain-containing protein, partial [Candidatus Micrarchaeia archaeon]
WHFDEESGTVAGDSSGNGNDGILTGTTIVRGKIGNARDFASGDLMSIATIDLPDNPGSEWTIEAWFKSPLFNIGVNCWNTLTSGPGPADDHQITVSVINCPPADTYFGTSVAGFNGVAELDASTLSDGWHHLAAVGQGGQTMFYLNGELMGTAGVQSTSNIAYIGNVGGGTEPFGTIDEVKIYSRALTVDEIKADMNCEVRA